ncbi:Transmembrane amino acid transporter protein [Popillia japonica]|uniref:Transmembrane amino acid transporter protein n=1 Tax=Popillia japonica TaxID=7064 RepID=A0AAW1LYV5_POPJA
MRNYNSFNSREPVWTQSLNEPEDGLMYLSPNHPLDKNGTNVFRKKNKKGLTVLQTAIFITGEMAGSGVLALPRAIVNSGWIGLILLVVFCFNAAFGGTRLGACWQILEERFPECRKKTRNPYATIAQKAVGKYAGVVVSGCIQFTLFGAGTVYLLLASQMLQELLNNFLPNLSLCFWFIVIGIFTMPLMWLGSPKDFRFVGVIAFLTTAVACILYFSQIVIDGITLKTVVPHRAHDFHDFFLAFGTLLFAFGGASTFPTIQNDMQEKDKFSISEKDKFSISVIIAFSGILLLYLPIAITGFFVYGEDVLPNVAMSITHSTLVIFANMSMAIHLIFAFLIVINPVCQELEEIFRIPHHYNWKRCLVRTVMLLVMVFVGETITNFGKILSLVGGSTITMLTFVFPQYFYLKLCRQRSPLWPEHHIPQYMKIYLWELILLGLIGGAASTYSAITAIFGANSFTKPCYWF